MRHRWRSVHQSLVDALTAELTDKGWVDAPTNFGATPVTILAFQPEVAGQTIAPNTVAITLDQPGPETPVEVGTGLVRRTWHLFVDVYAENASTVYALCDDLHDYLVNLRLNVTDHTQDPPVATDEMIEIDDEVDVDEPPMLGQVERHYWRTVVAPVAVYYVEGT